MTRKFNPKTDQKIIKVIPGETSEMLKLRMMLNVIGYSDTKGMSRIYSAWSNKQNNK